MARKHFYAHVGTWITRETDPDLNKDKIDDLAENNHIAWDRDFGPMVVSTRMSDAEAVSAALDILNIEIRYDTMSRSIQFRGANVAGSVTPLLGSDGWTNPDRLSWSAIRSKIEMRICKRMNPKACSNSSGWFSIHEMSMARFKSSCEAIANDRRV